MEENKGGLLDLGTNEGGTVSGVILGLLVVDMRSLGSNLVGLGVEVVGVVVETDAVGVFGVVDLALLKGLLITAGLLDC